jgi:hypothetical protein
MSQSTTTAGSQAEHSLDSSVMHSQDETFQNFRSDETPNINFPDRQEEESFSSQGSFVPCSVDIQLTQLSQSCKASTQSVSATPTPTVQPGTTAQDLSVEDKARRDIERMNEEFAKHKYTAFVHKNMHMIFRVYDFDLKPK